MFTIPDPLPRPRRHSPSRCRAHPGASLGGLALVVLAPILAGCRAYEPEPLELAAHRADLASRLDDLEPMRSFLARLAETGSIVPGRFDPADGLSLAEGEVLALFHNPRLRLARAEAGVAVATAATAGRWNDPVFGFDAEDILRGGESLIYGLTVQFTLPISGRLEVERDRADAALIAERTALVAAEWHTRALVRRAWIIWSGAVRRLALLEEVAEQAERIVALADRLEAAGALRRTDSRLLRVELDLRRADVIESSFRADTARLELLALMGLATDADVALEPAMDMPVAAAPPVTPDDPVARLIAANPALAVLRARHAVAEQSLRLEVRKQYPDLTIGGGYGSEGDDRLLLGFSFPIPIFDRNVQAIEEATARRTVARIEAENTLDRLAVDLARATARLETARRQQARFLDAIVPALATQSAELERLADLGEMDVLLVLDAVTRRFDAGLRVLDLREQEALAAIERAELLGPDVLPPPAPVADPTTGAGADAQPPASAHADRAPAVGTHADRAPDASAHADRAPDDAAAPTPPTDPTDLLPGGAR